MSPKQAWVVRGLEREREKRGYACQNVAHAVDDYTLEFAHLYETGCKGRSRGRINRLLDIRRNPGAYVLLCQTCHREFDRGYIENLVLTIQPLEPDYGDFNKTVGE
jgi:hypothetical protein